MHSPLPPDPVGPPALPHEGVPASAGLPGPDAAAGGEVPTPIPTAVETSHPIDRVRGAPGEPTPAERAPQEPTPADLPPGDAPIVTRSIDDAEAPPDAAR